MKMYDIDNLPKEFSKLPFTVDELRFSPTVRYDDGLAIGFTFYPYASKKAYDKRLKEVVGIGNYRFSILTTIVRDKPIATRGAGSYWTNPRVENRAFPLMVGRLEIKNPVTGEWVWSDETGTPSTKSLDPDKNQRDSIFKRCASDFGLGAELTDFGYSFDSDLLFVPFVAGKDGKPVTDLSTYVISAISYDGGQISDLQITNTVTGRVVYSYAERIGNPTTPPKKKTRKKADRGTVKISLSESSKTEAENQPVSPEKEEKAEPEPVTEKKSVRRRKKAEKEELVKSDAKAEVKTEAKAEPEPEAVVKEEPAPEPDTNDNADDIEVITVPDDEPVFDFANVIADVGGPAIKGKRLVELYPANIVWVFEHTHKPEVKQAIKAIAEKNGEVRRRLVNNGLNLNFSAE